MDLMGVRREEIIDYPNISIAGVEASSNEAGRSKVTLFI
jgi:peroxiredoxin family protein